MKNVELFSKCVESIEDYLYETGWTQHNETRLWTKTLNTVLRDKSMIEAFIIQSNDDFAS
jgi:hypothetical protein